MSRSSASTAFNRPSIAEPVAQSRKAESSFSKSAVFSALINPFITASRHSRDSFPASRSFVTAGVACTGSESLWKSIGWTLDPQGPVKEDASESASAPDEADLSPKYHINVNISNDVITIVEIFVRISLARRVSRPSTPIRSYLVISKLRADVEFYLTLTLTIYNFCSKIMHSLSVREITITFVVARCANKIRIDKNVSFDPSKFLLWTIRLCCLAPRKQCVRILITSQPKRICPPLLNRPLAIGVNDVSLWTADRLLDLIQLFVGFCLSYVRRREVSSRK